MKKIWIWKNFVNGSVEFLGFDNAFPCDPSGDPLTLGEPVGFVTMIDSVNGRPSICEDDILARISISRVDT